MSEDDNFLMEGKDVSIEEVDQNENENISLFLLFVICVSKFIGFKFISVDLPASYNSPLFLSNTLLIKTKRNNTWQMLFIIF